MNNSPKPFFAFISKLALLVMTLVTFSTAQSPRLLIRCDDIGMTHAVNQAFLK